MKKTMLLTAVLLAGSLTVVWAQTMTKQQALDEIARIERFNAQVEEMLRQAWEVARTQKETVIDAPYGKVTIKFDLAEKINSEYTGDMLKSQLNTWDGVQQGNEIRINTSAWLNKTPEGIKRTITHELGHYMDKAKSSTDVNRAELEADAFAMRHLKFDFLLDLQRGVVATSYIDKIIKRASEMEREERENLNRLRNIAGLSPQSQPQNAGTVRSYIDSGKAALNSKDNTKAIAYFSMAIWLDPNNAEAYFNRSEASGGYVADLTEAVRLDPNNNTYKEALRVAQEKQKAADQASQQAQRSQSAQSYYNSGYAALYNNKDYDKAIADFTEAVRLDPNDYTNFYFRAIAYIDKGDYDKAIADYNEVERLNPNSGSSLRISIHLAKKDYDKVIADCNEVLRRNPNSADAYRYRAEVYIAKKDYNKTIADCSEAIRINPNYTAAYTNRAEAYIGKRKYKEARADVDKALQLSPNYQKAKDLDAELKKRRL